jgi:SAM-dependent methyltransferase
VSLKDVYANRAICQIPRLLTLLDRNPASSTYGCFHRDYWLYKTSDFPDAVRQFGVHALALVYKHDFPGNVYKGQPKVRDWAIAALDFWARIQHRDGSFDEFYPYERGWVGPSAFTTYASVEAFRILKDEVPPEIAARVTSALSRAAHFVAAGESEEDHLANHHAMAALAVWRVYELTRSTELEQGFKRLWNGFLRYHNAAEGWSREYDAPDPGYLSATVSFLGKVYQTNRDPEIRAVLDQSAAFCSNFVYPNGFYAGSMGSRNTLHFYPHGFEILASTNPLAAAVAEKMLVALGEGKLVPPEIMSDRYVFYRVPELLLSYLDYSERPGQLPPLPYEQPPFVRYYPKARILVAKQGGQYILSNLAKGGVTKIFACHSGELLLNDCGILGRLEGGQLVSSQWIEPSYRVEASENRWQVEGALKGVPSQKLLTPFRNLIFRSALIGLGWSPALSHWLKGRIRKTLILKAGNVPVAFTRRVEVTETGCTVETEVRANSGIRLSSLLLGGEFFVRYVPQSQFFQSQELGISAWQAGPAEISEVNRGKRLVRVVTSTFSAPEKISEQTTILPVGNGNSSAHSRDEGVYGLEYFEGRHTSKQLIYRLHRRTDEVKAAISRFCRAVPRVVVDVGTADGMMLDLLRREYPDCHFVGIDLSSDLLRANPNPDVLKIQADALSIPVATESADAVIATAVIEHVSNAETALKECRRILKPGGILIITTPDPRMDKLASALGLLKDSGHQQTFTLTELRRLAERCGFETLEAFKFMFSPVGFPAEKRIEVLLRRFHLGVVMANQLVVGRKL